MEDRSIVFWAAAMACAACAAWPVDNVVSVFLDLPRDGAVVSQQNDGHRKFLSAPHETHIRQFADQEARNEIAAAGSWPEPVRFKWRAAQSVGETTAVPPAWGPAVLEIATDPGFSNVERRVECQLGQADVYNLRIAARYWWRVTVMDFGERAVVSETRTFSTEDATPRFLRIDGTVNARDLGGYVTTENRRVRQGMVYRMAAFNHNAWFEDAERIHDRFSEAIDTRVAPAIIAEGWLRGFRPGANRMTPAGLDTALNELKIKTDLDLRNEIETYGMTGSPLGPGVAWKAISFPAYRALNEPFAAEPIRRALSLFADPANYPIAIHCIAGQDRTGLLSALVEAILCVPEDKIVLDWEASAFNTPHLRLSMKRLDNLMYALGVPPGATLHERAVNYALHVGLTKEEVSRIREILLEP